MPSHFVRTLFRVRRPGAERCISQLHEDERSRRVSHLVGVGDEFAIVRTTNHWEGANYPAGLDRLWTDLSVQGLPGRGDHDGKMQQHQHQLARRGGGGRRLQRASRPGDVPYDDCEWQAGDNRSGACRLSRWRCYGSVITGCLFHGQFVSRRLWARLSEPILGIQRLLVSMNLDAGADSRMRLAKVGPYNVSKFEQAV